MGIDIAVHEQTEDGLVLVDRKREPFGAGDVLDQIFADGRVRDDRDDVGADDAEQNGDDLDHALAPDVGGDDDDDGDHRNPPVLRAVVDGGGRQVQTDGNDDRTRDDRREEAHDLLGAEGFEQRRKDDIYKTCTRDAEAGVGEHFMVRLTVDHGSDRCIAAEESERRAEERGDNAAGDEVEQQRAETGKQQRRGDVQTRQNRDQDRCAEHCEHVLEAEHKHSARAELSCIIDAFFGNFLFTHFLISSLHSASGKPHFFSKKRNCEWKYQSQFLYL